MKRLAVIAILLLMPLASAHGAPESRSIDTRIMTDTTTSGDYGGGGDQPLGDGGIDLLTLDVFEGTLPGTLEPAIVFRTIVQGGTPGEHVIELTGSADGTPFTLDYATTDLATYGSSTFSAIRGPFDVGDGHPKAIEGIVALSALGAAPGASLTDLRMTSLRGGEPEDIMPGTWYFQGNLVPLQPGETAGEPGTYQTLGPATFFTMDSETVTLPSGEANFTINVTSTIDLAQVLTLTVTAPDGVDATATSNVVNLDPDATASIALDVSGIGVGAVKVLVESDLGTGALFSVPIDSSANVGQGGDVGSGDMFAGDSFQYTFTAASLFEYHCHPHPWMMGAITIEEEDNSTAPETHIVRILEPDASDPNGWKFEPAEFTIEAGDTVLWINDGAMLHDIRGSTGLGPGGHDHDHDHDHDHEPVSEDSPGAFLLLPLLAALWVARRR